MFKTLSVLLANRVTKYTSCEVGNTNFMLYCSLGTWARYHAELKKERFRARTTLRLVRL